MIVTTERRYTVCYLDKRTGIMKCSSGLTFNEAYAKAQTFLTMDEFGQITIEG